MGHSERIYPAKLLMFGEHTVLKGSDSLAVPYSRYFMSWTKRKDVHPDWLTSYVTYLREKCSDILEFSKLESWIESHTIDANIPIGYGLGSSGALTAAVYDISAANHKHNSLANLQAALGLMESFFHGKSSGFDPLVSYCNEALYKRPSGIIKMGMGDIEMGINCYLLDSGSRRIGSEMIEKFLVNYSNFPSEMKELNELNNLAIAQILNVRQNLEITLLNRISQIQLKSMSYMIKPELINLWQEGIRSNDYNIKICGAGGGGYYLVFSKDELDRIGHYKLEKVEL